jgi:hypothetical protein
VPSVSIHLKVVEYIHVEQQQVPVPPHVPTPRAQNQQKRACLLPYSVSKGLKIVGIQYLTILDHRG